MANVAQFDGLSPAGGQPIPGSQVERDPNDPAMDDEQFSSAVRAAIDDAALYIDGYIAPQREQATLFYRGEPFGNEEKGRSQIVMTEVRDTVLAMMPSILRIFTASDEAVSFEPRAADKVEQAEQATDYVNYLFYNDNDGFQILYNAIKDALIRKTGIIKWRWDDDVEIYEQTFTDLSDGQVQMLAVEPDVEIISKTSHPDPLAEQAMQIQQLQSGGNPALAQQAPPAPPPGAAPPMLPPGAPPGAPPMPPPAGGTMAAGGAAQTPPMPPAGPPQAPSPPPMLHDVKIRRRRAKGRVKIECMPVEEFLCSRTARDLDTAALIGHRSIKTFSELVAMGYDPDKIEEVSGLGDTFTLNYEAQARNPAINAFLQTPDINDESATKTIYNEIYVRIDRDGDGIAELHKVCMVGSAVLHDEIVRDVPMCVLCPDPEPHMIIGSSVADQTMDLQLIKSNVVRNTLDSLSQAIHPRTAIVEGQVNIDDVLNVETGAIIRMKQPGMVQQLSEPFVGQQAMPVIDWLDNVKALRTGSVPATAGLDPDILQSTTKTAVDAAVMGAQERTEMTARLFAENGIKRMMKGILKLVCEHQDKPRMIRLRGKWVEVDPRSWDADMDVVVHVALGRGTDQTRMAGLQAILAKQELAIQLAGTSNPLAGLDRYRNTLAKMTELLGFKDVQQFWAPIDMQMIAQMEQQKAQNPPPDPNMLVAQAEMQKSQSMIASHRQEDQLKLQQATFDQQQAARQMQFDIWKVQMEDAAKREQMRINMLLGMQSNEAQYGAASINADQSLTAQRERLLADLMRHQHTTDAEMAQHGVEQGVELHKHAASLATDAAVARHQAETQADAQVAAARAKGNGNAAQ